jgi:hypothetical protein
MGKAGEGTHGAIQRREGRTARVYLGIPWDETARGRGMLREIAGVGKKSIFRGLGNLIFVDNC